MHRYVPAVTIAVVLCSNPTAFGAPAGGSSAVANETSGQSMLPSIGGHLGAMGLMTGGTVDYIPKLLGYARALTFTDQVVEAGNPGNSGDNFESTN